MRVQLFLPPSLQSLAGDIKEIGVEGKNVGECLEYLVEKYPRLKREVFTRNRKLRQGLSLYRNGEKTDIIEPSTPLAEGDKLYLLNVIFGG
jgi:molybdopterin converting factor small subunit